MKPLQTKDEVAFRKYSKTLKKDVLIDKLWEMLQCSWSTSRARMRT